MARKLEISGTSQNAQKWQSDETFRSDEKKREGAKNAAIERWLQLHLRQIYEEVSNEPLPSELSDMIERVRKLWQTDEGNRASAAPLAPSLRCGS